MPRIARLRHFSQVKSFVQIRKKLTVYLQAQISFSALCVLNAFIVEKDAQPETQRIYSSVLGYSKEKILALKCQLDVLGGTTMRIAQQQQLGDYLEDHRSSGARGDFSQDTFSHPRFEENDISTTAIVAESVSVGSHLFFALSPFS